ncbi:hypothetical protein EWM62_05885 [Mucilaginibacter terrigena]|uniref:Lipoprotein n=1 Tax=Mucilaginibacter terrigena TaxID=2492395 RepID=A0A4Q5LPW2_9SPHI|nr:hypothetical protein [Mucilaginibacter terrigena]RYU91468.1 hypothetical protein EWM62_05885 [Mucilaginibacter terrigena]
MKKKLLYLSFAGLLVFTGCAEQKQLNSSYTYKTECLGVEFDGAQNVMAFSDKRNKEDAIEDAKRAALRDVLFNGITDGKPDCDVKPILNEANAYANHQDYFIRFFANDYRPFATFKEERPGQKAKNQKVKNVAQSTGYVISISRPALKQKMISDGILKSN